MKSVTVHEAKSTLSKLLAATESGEEIVVCRGEVPVAKLVPFRTQTRLRPRVGEVTSKPVTYSDDCFAPLDGAETSLWGLR